MTAALYLSGIHPVEPELILGVRSFEDLCKEVDRSLNVIGTSQQYDVNLAKAADIISCKYRKKGSLGDYHHAHFAAISQENPDYLLQRPAYNTRMEVIPGSEVLAQLGRTRLTLEVLIFYYKKPENYRWANEK